jgi:hypothetical protein
MALVPKTLEEQIYFAFSKSQLNASRGEDTLPALCEDLATAIDIFVKSATVKTEVTGEANGGVCVPGGPVAKAVVIATGLGAPGIGLS